MTIQQIPVSKNSIILSFRELKQMAVQVFSNKIKSIVTVAFSSCSIVLLGSDNSPTSNMNYDAPESMTTDTFIIFISTTLKSLTYLNIPESQLDTTTLLINFDANFKHLTIYFGVKLPDMDIGHA